MKRVPPTPKPPTAGAVEKRPAPPVYRPTSAAVSRLAKVAPKAPPVYRPVQRGVAPPPVYRPTPPALVQQRPAAPAVSWRPVPGILQRAESKKTESKETAPIKAGWKQVIDKGRKKGEEPYDDDMIRGGDLCVKLNLKKLIQFWDKNQNNDSTLQDWAIKEYVALIKEGGSIEAPYFESITGLGPGLVEIRTGNGRHRIKAAELAGLTEIYMMVPAEKSLKEAEASGVKKDLFPDL